MKLVILGHENWPLFMSCVICKLISEDCRFTLLQLFRIYSIYGLICLHWIRTIHVYCILSGFCCAICVPRQLNSEWCIGNWKLMNSMRKQLRSVQNACSECIINHFQSSESFDGVLQWKLLNFMIIEYAENFSPKYSLANARRWNQLCVAGIGHYLRWIFNLFSMMFHAEHIVCPHLNVFFV